MFSHPPTYTNCITQYVPYGISIISTLFGSKVTTVHIYIYIYLVLYMTITLSEYTNFNINYFPYNTHVNHNKSRLTKDKRLTFPSEIANH